MDKKYLCYEDFGAVGDGKTDDFAAIIACHSEANRLVIPVKTKDGAKYYIGGKNATAHIRTDVDFGTSEFIIDDRSVENISAAVFTVDSEKEGFSPKITSLKKGQKRIDFPHEGNVYVQVFNDEHKIYIRKGLNMNAGTATQECFTVDADGNIGEPIDWDYPKITKTYAKSIDDTPITVKGGIFTTVANQAPSLYTYYHRGFRITRSNVTMTNITHYVTGELEHGAPYHGFIHVSKATNLTVKDSLLTPRLIYWTPSEIPGKLVDMGSYDISINDSISVKLLNVTQSISITDTEYWGIYTSNFCKDLVLTDCVLSRFDAHMGVTGLTVKRCKFGHQFMKLIGHGNALIEDTEVCSARQFIDLRGDYGSLWDGNITLRRCALTPFQSAKNAFVITSFNAEDHDFGFECMLGRNITVEDFVFHDLGLTGGDDVQLTVLRNYIDSESAERPFTYVMPKSLEIGGVIADSHREIKCFSNPEIAKETKIVSK